jgi:glutathione S-transferase
MTYTLITANRNYSSWSLRPWLLMKGLGIAFEDRIEPFTKPSNYEEFRAFSPTGQVPVLLHEGRTIYDSMGIAGRRMQTRAHGRSALRARCIRASLCCEATAR